MTRSEADRRPPAALAVINGDDVYEDLFTAATKLADILVSAGFATRAATGTGRLDQDLMVADLIGTGSRTGPGPDHRTVCRLIGSRSVSHGPESHESRFLVETDQRRSVTRRLAPFEITHGHDHIETAADVRVIAWRRAAARREPVAHVWRAGRGRVCYLQLGHDTRARDDPPVRAFVIRAARWARPEVAR